MCMRGRERDSSNPFTAMYSVKRSSISWIRYLDLSKQISLLIMDDDEDPVVTCPSVSLQVLHHIQPSFHFMQNCFNLSPEETIQLLHHLNSCMTKIAEEKAAREREFLSPSLHSQEGNTDKEDTAKSPITGSMIIQEWFLKYRTTIVSSQRKANLRLYMYASEVHDSIISTTNLIANKGLKQDV
ncbi:unnamed protein product [Dovyalis caffra]|uniref:Uncharacterized protein n=1 Tax=Dovyalis caffra TaxID=77055 RepID=A0AAV1RC31_9ROSI|nr:unnamed protein product [Dovyalis caffra]